MGGAEKYALRIAKAFAERSHPVTLFTSGPVIHQDLPFEIRTIPMPKGPSVSKVRSFDSFCSAGAKRKSYPLILGLDRNSHQTHIRASNGVHAAFLKRRKAFDSFLKCLSFSFNPLHRLLLDIEKKSFENPDLRLLVTNSHMVKLEILEHYRVDCEKIQVVHNGVEWAEWQEAFNAWPSVREEQLKALGLPQEGFYFLFLGHNYHRKGLEYLLKGFSLLKERRAYLLVVGRDKNPEVFKAEAEALGIQDRVVFTGSTATPRVWYQVADAAVIPSLYDPFANVTVEALAMGNFVISSNANGGSEILSQESGSIIPDLLDAESVASCLARALNFSKMKDAALIRNSIQHLDFANQMRTLVNLCLSTAV